MLWAASVEDPMGSKSTFLPVACSKVRVTGILWPCFSCCFAELVWRRGRDGRRRKFLPSSFSSQVGLDAPDSLDGFSCCCEIPVLGTGDPPLAVVLEGNI